MPVRDPDCAFCGIVGGQTEAHVVYEDEAAMAFLDNRPLFHGHSLLVPRDHHATLAELPSDLVGPFFAATRLLSRAVPEAMGAEGSFVAINNVVSQSVPHLHVHVVPRVRKDGLRGFFWPRSRYPSSDDAARTAQRVRAAVEALSRRA